MQQLEKTAKRAVVVGASPSGLAAALRLSQKAGDEIRVVIVDERGEHLLEHLLYDYLTGRRGSLEVAVPLQMILGGTRVDFACERVIGIDFGARKVATACGSARGSFEYDYLVLAPASVADCEGVADAEKNAFPLMTIADAEKLRDHVVALFDKAAREQDPQKRRAMLTIAICGKGEAGAELALAVSEWLDELRLTHWVPRDEIEVVYVEQAEAREEKLDGKVGELFEAAFRERGVRYLRDDIAVKVAPRRLHLKSGVVVDSMTVVWKAGVKPHPLIGKAGLELDERGRAIVDPFMRTDLSGVYVAGDGAAPFDSKGKPAEAVRSLSGRGQGILVAEDAYANVRGRAPRLRRELRAGRLIKLGERQPLLVFGRRKVIGPPLSKLAELVRNFVSLYLLGGWRFMAEYREWVELERLWDVGSRDAA